MALHNRTIDNFLKPLTFSAEQVLLLRCARETPMWMIMSMAIGAILVVLGLTRSYYRLLAVALVLVILSGVGLAMLGGPVD